MSDQKKFYSDGHCCKDMEDESDGTGHDRKSELSTRATVYKLPRGRLPADAELLVSGGRRPPQLRTASLGLPGGPGVQRHYPSQCSLSELRRSVIPTATWLMYDCMYV